MSSRGGGRGRGGGGGRGRVGGDAPVDPHSGGRVPQYAAAVQQRGGGRGGRGPGGPAGGGRGRDGGGDGPGGVPPSYGREQPGSSPQQPPSQEMPRPADAPSSSTSAVVAATQEVERLSISGSATPASPVSGSAVVPAPVAAQFPPASSKAMRHPARPGYGTLGRKCLVRANHFLVSIADKDLCHYDVAITPEVSSRAVNRAIVSELVKLYKESHLGRLIPAYDGRKSLYTAGELPFKSKEFVIKLPEREEQGKPRRGNEFRVAIKFATRADLHHLAQFLKGNQMDMPQETIQVLDVVFREAPSNKYVTVARSFFSPKFGDPGEIGEGLECWRGYYQSLRPTQMGLSLNIDISATSFYKAISVLQFVKEYLNLRDLSRPISDTDRVKIKRALRGIRVEATHTGNLRRRYKISGLTSVAANQLMFQVDEQGARISVAQYFRDRYNHPLKYASWPCLQAGSDSRPTYLPMEVCNIVEGQRYSKKLNERQVTEILRSTCQRPQDRENSIIKMVNMNNYDNDDYVKAFGMKVIPQLTSVEARILPPPRLKYHESGREKMCNPSVGQWNMINKKMVNGGVVETWTCVSFSRLPSDAVYNFCDQLVGMCSNIGMTFNRTPFIDIRGDRPDRVEAALREVKNQSFEAFSQQGKQGKQLQLLLVVLPEASGSYGKIKRICETELGIVTQCFLPKHVSRCNKQYLENVALKINVKVGGRNTVLEDAVTRRIPLVTDRPTIIFGADVTHPPPGEDSSASIAAVVASMDWPEVTKYRGLVSAQPHRQEMIQDLYSFTQDPQRGSVHGGMIRELLIGFYKTTKVKPSRIIFYRDGVSEGQFSHVLLYEMDAIRKACASLQDGYLPPVTFVVVQKRHHTRLFPAIHGNRDMTDRSGNILPGTVVDTKICHPTEFDFYLCSHAGIQGTSRPTHYHVLVDENGFSADLLQTLTNNLCYTYARCTRSVSLVPPAYYAHLAAFRARYYVEGEPSDGGSTVGPNVRARTAEVRPLPKVMDNVKDVMFFC